MLKIKVSTIKKCAEFVSDDIFEKKQSILVQLVFLQIGFYMARAQLGYAIHVDVFISVFRVFFSFKY